MRSVDSDSAPFFDLLSAEPVTSSTTMSGFLALMVSVKTVLMLLAALLSRRGISCTCTASCMCVCVCVCVCVYKHMQNTRIYRILCI